MLKVLNNDISCAIVMLYQNWTPDNLHFPTCSLVSNNELLQDEFKISSSIQLNSVGLTLDLISSVSRLSVFFY